MYTNTSDSHCGYYIRVDKATNRLDNCVSIAGLLITMKNSHNCKLKKVIVLQKVFCIPISAELLSDLPFIFNW